MIMDIKDFTEMIKRKRDRLDSMMPVSYTHLTLPTT